MRQLQLKHVIRGSGGRGGGVVAREIYTRWSIKISQGCTSITLVSCQDLRSRWFTSANWNLGVLPIFRLTKLLVAVSHGHLLLALPEGERGGRTQGRVHSVGHQRVERPVYFAHPRLQVHLKRSKTSKPTNPCTQRGGRVPALLPHLWPILPLLRNQPLGSRVEEPRTLHSDPARWLRFWST